MNTMNKMHPIFAAFLMLAEHKFAYCPRGMAVIRAEPTCVTTSTSSKTSIRQVVDLFPLL